MVAKPTIGKIIKQPESIYALIICFGIIFTTFSINLFTNILFGKDFIGRNLYFQVLFFGLLTIVYSFVILFIVNKLTTKQPFQAFFSKLDLFYTNYWNWIFWLFFLGITLLFILLKKSIFNMDNLRIWKDTTEYVLVSSHPLFSKEFIFGNRTLALPLFYKILGVTKENYRDTDTLFRIAITQFWISIITWSTLSAAISMSLKKHGLKIIAFILVFLLSLGLQNSQWEKLILSESLSNSLFICLLALFLVIPNIKNFKESWKKMVYYVLVLLVSLAYSFARDTNAFFLLLVCCCTLLFIVILKKDHLLRKVLIVTSMIYFISFSLTYVNSLFSTRWEIPLVHVLEDRKNSYQVLTNYFYKKGLDLFITFPDPLTPTSTSISTTTEINSQNLALMIKAKSVYMQFLIVNPKYFFFSPIINLPDIISPYSSDYRYNFNGTADWAVKLNQFIYPISSFVYPLGIMFILLSIFLDPKNNGLLKILIIFLFISVFPLGWLIWHADTQELMRHSEQLLIQSRVAFWLSILCFLDARKFKLNNFRIINNLKNTPKESNLVVITKEPV